MKHNPKKNKELIALTSIRGIAALWVVLYHFIAPLNRDVACFSCYLPPLERSYLAVDLFFILSGFILAYVYLEKFTQDNSNITIPFLKARIARIYPLHLFCLLAFATWHCSAYFLASDYSILPRNNLETFTYNIFLVHAWGVWDDVSWNYPSWSISTELFAYISLTILFSLMIRNKAVQIITFILSVIAIVAYPFLSDGFTIGNGQALYRCLACFYLGVSCFLLFGQCSFSTRLATVIQLITLSLLFIGIFIGTNDGILMLLWCPLIYSLSHDKGIIANVLKYKFLYFLGVISYSIYLTHAVIFMIYRDIRVHYFKLPPNLGLMLESLLLVGLVLLTILISYYTYNNIEKKYRKVFASK